MHRYRLSCRLLGVGLTVFAAGCQVPSARENAAAAAELVALQIDTPLEWRRDPAADEAARQRAATRLDAPLALDDAIAVGFLQNPDLQIVFEQLEISRSDLIAAATPPNPVAVVGTRKPGGDLAAFYPDQSVSFGVLQNVLALLSMPDRKAVARLDLARARDEAAQRVFALVADVTEAWIEYAASVEVAALRETSLGMVRSAYERLLAEPPSDDPDARTTLHSQYESLLKEESDAARARAQAQTARHRLAGLLGIAGWRDDWQIVAGLPVPPDADPDAAALEAAAMRQRSDLLAAAHAFESRLRALATRNRFRWLDTLEIGIFRDKAIGGTAFTGPNAVFEVPLFDQRQGALLAADAELQIALRRLQSLQQVARAEVRTHAGAVAAARWNLRQFDERLRPHRRAVAAESGAGDAGLAYADVADGIERVALVADYWRARVALALASGDWRSAGVAR